MPQSVTETLELQSSPSSSPSSVAVGLELGLCPKLPRGQASWPRENEDIQLN